MRTLLCAASVTLLVASVLPRRASAVPAGCVDILTDCDANSSLLTTVCGTGLQELSGDVASNISFVVFGANVQSATLIQCGSGKSITITQSTNICDLGDDWNDNICALSLTLSESTAPALRPGALVLLSLLLFVGGMVALRRRTYPR